ncbi:hypothetical protein L227DRAFT_378842 [Lentinus tigrinus ALCF2SS1-6]|uniref:Fungal-type protein kinase domain-containing protein n=1 Tax=Lentinus tigrinus ALCF2SS1-6 TaxID=1328759 RepID=A0A5C2RR60_9APHY|nr:hypothetical protein L227DRAFT_378842 [Lentinus tigrinus ALCF2SS1-6]
MDCPETTILMPLGQFQHEHLFNLGADLETTRPETFVSMVWWSLHSELGDMPHEAGEKPLRSIKSEKELSNVWAKVDRENNICKGNFLHISDSNYDPTDIYKYKVDGSFVPNSDRKAVTKRHPHWAYVSFLLEFKRGGTECDPFDDTPGHDPDATAKTRRAVRGQIMSYAERVFAYQHRTAVFLIFVNGDMFRVMRWDRSGVIVSEAVDYVSTIAGTRALLEVTHALSKLSQAQRGLDTTAVRLLKDSCGWQRMDMLAQAFAQDLDHAERAFDDISGIHEVFLNPDVAATYGALCVAGKKCKLHGNPTHRCRGSHRSPPDIIPVFSFIRELFRESLKEDLPRYELTVDGRKYLVGQHIFLGFGLVGRGTRGYVALDWETQRFVFLKDSWRPYYPGVEQEGEILSKLNEKKVRNVPTLIGYGDVCDVTRGKAVAQETLTSQYHPDLGKKVVDWDQPPFPQSARPVTEVQAEFEQWVSKMWQKNDPNQPNKRVWHSDSKAVKQKLLRLYARKKATGKSAPTGPAFPPGPSKSARTTNAQPPAPRRKKRTADTMIAEDRRIQGGGLRHMIHTRLVEKEICLPFTEFTSSRQLVRIIFDCIRAHGIAYIRCEYMHRDVSAGNLLIYPRIIVSDCDKTVDVFWQGLLADWELAKHSSKKSALQPQRTGTWHFMSAYLLSHPNDAVAIADELEAFLHILVYGAVRRVRSNMNTFDEFLRAYFAGCDVNPETQKVCCPGAKRESVVIGQTLAMSGVPIVFSSPDGQIANTHPLNEIIAVLFELFHSRYAVLGWQDHSGSGADNKPTTPRTPSRSNPIPRRPRKVGYEEDPELPVDKVAGNQPTKPPQQPTPEMYAHFKALETHKKVADIFYTYAYDEEKVFPPDDVIPDRLNEVDPTTESQASAANASNSTDASTPECADADGAKDASAARDPSQPVDGSAAADDPSISADEHVEAPEDDARRAEAGPTIAAPQAAGRPTKRRRRDPVLQAEAPAADFTTGRMTRSRSAAMMALAAAAAPPPPPAPPPAPPAPVPAAPAEPPVQPVPVAQTSTRVTRSKSGKLPGPPGGRAGGATLNVAVAPRASRGRSTAVARAAGGAAGRRAAGRSTQVETRGRRTRRS